MKHKLTAEEKRISKKESDKKYYQKNKARIKEYNKKYHQRNKAKAKEYYQKYNNKNKAGKKEYNKQYRQNHKAEAREYRQNHKAEAREYKQNHKAGIKEYNKQYRHCIGVDALPLFEEEAKKRQGTSTGGTNPQLTPLMEEGVKGESTEQAGKIAGVSRSYVAEAREYRQNHKAGIKEYNKQYRHCVGVDALPLFEAEAKKRQIRKPNFVGPLMVQQNRSSEQVAKQYNVSKGYVIEAKRIQTES